MLRVRAATTPIVKQKGLTEEELPGFAPLRSLPLNLPISPRQRTNYKVTKEFLPPNLHVQREIGRGTFGKVFEAWDVNESKLVAVKWVPKLFRDLTNCRRILREIAILSQLDHPCLVRLFYLPNLSHKSSFDELFLVMELGDTDMDSLLCTDVSLTPLHITNMFYNVLLGLNYLHSAGICHRDLKPANCLINHDCSVKLCDFGMARSLSMAFTGTGSASELDDAQPAFQRQLSHHVVTRWYRAPEIILLQEVYTEAVDVWSLGCVFAELLGMLPGVEVRDRRPLFPGGTCFPLTPNQAHRADVGFHTTSYKEQLNVIFDIMGTPSPDDVSFLSESSGALRYLAEFTPRAGCGLRCLFGKRNVSEDHFTALERSLRFNPNERATVSELLSSQVVAVVRDVSKETLAPASIHLSFESMDLNDELRLRSCICRVVADFAARGWAVGQSRGSTATTLTVASDRIDEAGYESKDTDGDEWHEEINVATSS